MSKFIHVYDCEMSHANRDGGDIIALACVVARTDTLELVDTFVDYGRPRNPEQFWHPGAEKIHGIPLEKALTFQSQRDLALKVLHFLKPYKNEDDSPMPFVMHSSSWVDYAFVRKMYEKVELLNSFEKVGSKELTVRTDIVFKEYLKSLGYPNPKKSNLKRMAEEFDINLDHHEAESDALACFGGLKEMIMHFKDAGPIKHPRIDFSAFNLLVDLYKG